MSNTTYNAKIRTTRKVSVQPAENYLDEEAYEEGFEELPDEGYDEEGYDEAPVGIFSTPARTAAVVVCIALLFVVAGSLAWLLGQKSHPVASTGTDQGSVAVSSLAPGSSLAAVPVIANSNPGYAAKPAGLSEAPKVGAMAPNFQWKDPATGKLVTLESLHGKPVLVNFWGTWCPPCRAEMPEMEKIYANVKNDVTFLGVSMGPRDEPLMRDLMQVPGFAWISFRRIWSWTQRFRMVY